METNLKILDLGPCCACGTTGSTVRNICCLEKKSPTPGKGWGCFLCGLPPDGAFYVLCDPCMESGAEAKFVCRGHPGTDGRVPISELRRVHEHDMVRHFAPYHPTGAPLYFREMGPPLTSAMNVLAEAEGETEAPGLVRLYLEYWIRAPLWRNHFDEGKRKLLDDLAAEIRKAKTVRQVRLWIHQCLEHGIDPL